jgi:hypothetical protein
VFLVDLLAGALNMPDMALGVASMTVEVDAHFEIRENFL